MMKHPFWFGLAWFVVGNVIGFLLGINAISWYIMEQVDKMP